MSIKNETVARRNIEKQVTDDFHELSILLYDQL